MIIIYYLGLSHAVFGATLLVSKRPKHISNSILAIWLLLLGLVMLGEISPVPIIDYFRPGLFPIFLCFGPFLMLYIKSVTFENYRFSKAELIHFLPFVLVVLHRSFSEPVNFGPGGGFDFRNEGQIINFVYFSLTTLSISVYTVLAFIMIRKHKSNLSNIYSYRSSRNTLNWLRIISLMFLLIFTINFVVQYFGLILSDDLVFMSFQSIGVVLFILMASFFGVNQDLIYSEQLTQKESISEVQDDKKYSKSGLSETQLENIKSSILNHLRCEKPYLDSEYNINMMAEELDTPRHHITQAINSNLNKNFYSLINEYRVEEVVSRISSGHYSNYTLLAIAFDAGFNSKSAFNRIFKQTTGQTPSDYKSSKVNIDLEASNARS